MSEVINSIFGRTSRSDEHAAGSATAQPGTVATETIPAETVVDETADETSDRTTETVAENDVEDTAEATPVEDDATEADRDEAEADDTEDVDEGAEDVAEDVDETDDEDEDVAEEEEILEGATEDSATEDDEDEAVVAVEAVPARAAAATRGSTSVDDEVVSKVVNMVARKAEGVHDLGEGVAVAIEGDVVTVKISLVIVFGHAVKAVAEQLRVDVIEAVEQFLGLDVAAVDVRVSDIHLPDAG